MLRVIGIWLFGIPGFAAIGAMVGENVRDHWGHDMGLMGAVAGAAIFGCLRLWLADRR